MGLALTQTQPGFSPQAASASDIADTKAARAQLSGLRSQICSVKNTIAGLTQMLEADKPGSTTPHRLSWKEAVMNIVQNNYFRDPKDRLANTRVGLFQAKEYLDALQKQVEPLEEADLIFKTNKKIVKKEARLAEFEAQKKPTHDDRKSIDALRAELHDLRTNRETLLIKYAARAMHMHAEAAMPFEQILQGCDLSQPAKMLCNAVTWITTQNMVAGGPGPLALPGLEAANATALYADAPLSRVPNGTSVTVDGGPMQLPLQLWAAPQGAAPAPTTSNNPPTTITPPSAGAVADRQQRQRADRLIDEIITSMPNPGYMPQDGNHDPVLALAVQTKGWPAYAKLEVLDAKGQHLATFAKQADSRTNQTITLQRRSNGEYVNAHDPHQSASNQEQLLTLLIQNQPRNSQLGRGGNFWGSDKTEGRIVTLRQQIADLAKAARPELFKAVIHSNCSQTDPGLPAAVKNRFMPLERSPNGSELMRKLHSENPHLTPARLTELLDASPLSATEQYVYLESGHLPTAFTLNKARIEQAVQHEQAVDAIYHTRTYNPQADALLREATTQELLKVNRNLRIFGKGETFDTQTAKAGDVILRDWGNGVYWAYDVPNAQYIQVNTNTDSFFRSIASVLQPHEHRALGMTGEPDVRGFRQHMGRAIEQNPSLRPSATSSTQIPFATDLTRGLNKNGRGSVLHNEHGQSEGFTSVARTITGQSSCTATLVDTYEGGGKESPAIVVTAGHCVGTKPDSIEVDRPLSGRVEFGWFADTPVVSFKMNKVLFSSRRRTDIAVIELKDPIQSLMRAGITPTPLASLIPPNGTDIVTAGFPKTLSPYFMHASACSNVDMGQYSTSRGQPGYRDSVINHCLDVGPGSSGGPVMIADRQLFAVISGGRYENQQVEYVITAPVTHLKDCIVNGRFSFNGQNCELSPVFNITPDRDGSDYAKIKLDSSGNSILPGWNFEFETDSGFYRHKTVDDLAQCENPADYGPPVKTQFH